MNIDTATPVPAPRRSLAEMADDVRVAREEVAAQRISPVVQATLLSARQELLRVMQVYSDELTARRLPIPPQLRDDLRLHRDIRRNPGSDWHRRGGAL